MGPVHLYMVILALLSVCLRATFLSRLAMRSLSSLLLQGMGLIQRTLTLACSTSELSLSLPFSLSDSDLYSLVMSGIYLVLSSSEIAVEYLSTLARFNPFFSGDNKMDAILELKLTTFTLFVIHNVPNAHNH